jgi:hypothetical protein
MTVVFNTQIKKGLDTETDRLTDRPSVSTWIRLDVPQSRGSKYLKTGRVTDQKLDHDHCSRLETRPCEKNYTARGVRSSDYWCRGKWCKVKGRIWLKRRIGPNSHRPPATVTPPPRVFGKPKFANTLSLGDRAPLGANPASIQLQFFTGKICHYGYYTTIS